MISNKKTQYNINFLNIFLLISLVILFFWTSIKKIGEKIFYKINNKTNAIEYDYEKNLYCVKVRSKKISDEDKYFYFEKFDAAKEFLNSI